LVQKLRTIVPNLEVIGRGMLYRAVLSHVEKLLLSVVLSECRGNQVKSADILGINRNTLRKKLREFGITSPRRNGLS
jgi:two-component system, NtrC family, nitrogen regulation response regulator GlnG